MFGWLCPVEKIVKGQLVLISGGAQGLGRSIALKLAALGSIVVVWDVFEDAGVQLIHEIESRGGEAHSYRVDVTDRTRVYELGAALVKRFGEVDILVNNAGILGGRRDGGDARPQADARPRLDPSHAEPLIRTLTCTAVAVRPLQSDCASVSEQVGRLRRPRRVSHLSACSFVCIHEKVHVSILSTRTSRPGLRFALLTSLVEHSISTPALATTMTSVAPASTRSLASLLRDLSRDSEQPRRWYNRLTQPVRSRLSWMWTAWRKLQLSHQGKYSIERLMAIEDYYRNTSVLRMLLVCVATPLPALILVILIEFIPLQPPSAGSFANWGFWLRQWITLFIMVMAMTTQVKVIIPELPFTTAKCLMISFVTTSIYTGLAALVGHLVVFPVPFLSVFGGVPGVAIACAMVLVVLRIRPSTMDPVQRTQLQRFFRICFSSGLLLIAYPSYNAVFVASSAISQSLLIIALQTIKLGAKNLTARALSHLEDYLPEYVVLLVEVFNALYLTTCMQNANSLHTILLITGLDYGQSLWELHAIRTHASAIQRLLCEYWEYYPGASELDFLAFAISICRNPDKLNRKEMKRINLRACLKHKVSLDHAKLLNTLDAEQVFNHGGRERRESVVMTGSQLLERPSAKISPLIRASSTRDLGSIVPPHPCVVDEAVQREPAALESLAGVTGVLTCVQRFTTLSLKDQRSSKLLFQIVQSLFHVECIVLVEYVECVVPFVYLVYSAARSQLPSEEYYPKHHNRPDGSFDWSLLGNVLLYTGLEFVSFIFLNVMCWWKLRYLPLYQLAFVLENQVELVQSKLVLWIIFLLQFQLYHYGADFTFRFAWIH